MNKKIEKLDARTWVILVAILMSIAVQISIQVYAMTQ